MTLSFSDIVNNAAQEKAWDETRREKEGGGSEFKPILEVFNEDIYIDWAEQQKVLEARAEEERRRADWQREWNEQMNNGPHGEMARCNFYQSWHHVNRLPGVRRWYGWLYNRPAIVAGFGPSLERVIPLLKEHQDGYCVIAVDAAYDTLKAAGISPDITVTCDPQDIATKFLANHEAGDLVAARVFKPWSFWERVPADDVAVYTEVLADDIDLYRDVRDEFFAGDAERFGQLFGGGIVGTDAVSLAFSLGCDPIVMVGMDLSFATEEQRRDGSELLQVEDMNGNSRYTTEVFRRAAEWFGWAFTALNEAAPKPATFINATGAGILVESCEVCIPERVIPKFAGGYFKYAKLLRKLLRK